MHETEAVGVGILGEPHHPTYLKSLLETVEEEPFVDLAVFETQKLHCDAFRLAEAGAEDVAVVVGDSDCVASLKALCGIVDGTREHPRMEAFDGFFLAGVEPDDRIERSLFH